MALSFLLSTLVLLSLSNAFQIDGSCQGNNEVLMRDAATKAFSMADAAVIVLDQKPQDANVNRLISLLFCAQGEDPATKDISRMRTSFVGIQAMAAETRNPIVGNTREVVIYCNIDRVSKRPHRATLGDASGGWYDNVSNNRIGQLNEKDHDLDDCGSRSGKDLAFTWIPPRVQQQGAAAFTYHPSQVTICPWFLQWSHKQRFKTWQDVSKRAKAARTLIPIATSRLNFFSRYTPIDAETLLDKVLLHEFTHTVAGGQLADVKVKPDGGDTTSNKAYGWKAAKNLAKENSANPKRSPFYNSDSLALFASGVRLLKSDPSRYISDGGSTTSKNPLGKREIPPELHYPGTPEAFEGFITLVKEQRAAATGGAS